ncbi:MAG: hypothetical protein IJR90_05060 [Clostridia bacterium]|nr:hypothetical protein [Clostridia bacterium]
MHTEKLEFADDNFMNRFEFRQMKTEDITAFIDEMFSILASNMDSVAPTGNSYIEDYNIWRKSTVPAWIKGNSSVILIFCKDDLCGYFQYSINDTTFKMEEIQFKQEYRGSGLFSELYHYLTTIVPVQTKYVDAITRKENIKSQEILKHLGLIAVGENKNRKSIYFEGEYKTIFERYSKK